MESAFLKTSGKIMQIGSKEWSDLIIEGARSLDIKLDYDQTEKFAIHARELIHWNKTFNLTAITDPVEVALKHFLDSLPALHYIPSDAALLDIGTGGGFPGLPLKICMPSLSAALIDASRKKVNFLKHVIRTLKLNNVTARHVRAEDLTAENLPAHRFDVIISRAFSSLNHFLKLALPLLAEHGTVMALKGEVDQDELESLQERGTGKARINMQAGRYVVQVKKFRLPFIHAARSLILIRIA